jgi:hypothetical protein
MSHRSQLLSLDFVFYEAGSRYVAQAGLELLILLPQPLEYEIMGMHP